MTVPALADDLNPEVEHQLELSFADTVKVLQGLEREGAVKTNAVGLSIEKDLTYEQYEAIGRALGVFNRACSWWVGDWLLHGEGAFAEKYAQAASETGLAEQTLLNRMYVCKHVPPSRRRPSLPFSVHAEVAALSAREQKVWLDRSERNGWTRADLRAAMKARRKDEAPPIPDLDEEQLNEVALAILRDAKPAEDGANHLVPNDDIARLRAALGQEED